METESRGVDFRLIFGTAAGSEEERNEVDDEVFHGEWGGLFTSLSGYLDQEFVRLEDRLRILHFREAFL